MRDLIQEIQYVDLLESALINENDYLLLIEFVYNMWMLANTHEEEDDIWPKNFYYLREVLNECLENINYTFHYNEETEQLIVVEANPEVTAVAEIVEPELVDPIIRYNHFSLKGDIKTKRTILFSLGHALDAKREGLKGIDKGLEECIYNALNNLNIRHNNCDSRDPNSFRPVIASMPDADLEQYYDDLYQLILYANLELDNLERKKKMKEFLNRVNAK